MGNAVVGILLAAVVALGAYLFSYAINGLGVRPCRGDRLRTKRIRAKIGLLLMLTGLGSALIYFT